MTASLDPTFEFGPFRLDPRRRRLSRDGRLVQLSPKTVEVLTLLVSRSGTLVDKTEMLDELWPDTFVEEANLAVHISTLRKALGEPAGGERYIETVPRRGYRFVVPVREVAPMAAESASTLVVEEHERTEIVIEELAPSLWRPSPVLVWTVVGLSIVCMAAVVLLLTGWRTAGDGAPEEARGIAGAPRESANAKAREAVLRGRYFWNQRSNTGIDKSIACFKEAIEYDPASAQAHAGLADAYAFDIRRWEEAESLARKALALDPSLGEAHATIGFVRMYWLHDWETAGAEFALANEARPDYATGHQWYGLFLAARGRIAEAETQLRRARDLDPLSLAINLDLARVLFFARRYDDSIEQCRKTIELDAKFAPAYIYLHDALIQKGLYPEAFEALVRGWEAFGKPPVEVQTLRDSYGYGGMAAVWGLRTELEYQALSCTELAECAMLHGDRDGALAWLVTARERQDLFVVFVRVHPAFDGLRDHPQFRELERRLNLDG